MAETLHALTFPLWGSRLIEASAGTGKTWTIAALYLRLVLGHGVAHPDGVNDGARSGFGRPLLPSEILVMTFTRAATRELSDRIRSRLLEAARCFRGEARPEAGDAFLVDLLDAYADGPPREAAAWRLAMAAEGMDDASVHTIDAWCQRMLREHAFDSGCLFDERLGANERAMRAEAAQDYWRQQLYPLTGEALDVALEVWKNVDALTADARELLDQTLPEGSGQGSLGELVAQLSLQRGAMLAGLKRGWAQRVDGMRRWLEGQFAADDCPFNKARLRAQYFEPWLAALSDWAIDPRAVLPGLTAAARTRLTPAGMQDALNPGAVVEWPDHFAAFEQTMAALDQLPSLAAALRAHAGANVARRLAELKRQAGTFGFADMLTRLDHALDAGRNGVSAERLRERILAQYPAALVDEFQDTSPVQSRIFDRLYRIAQNDPATALLLIGDPKQSIYGFRGADIYSYLSARRATQGRHYVLGTNHRSTRALVAAVNHLFAQAEARAGEGAFMFRARQVDVDGLTIAHEVRDADDPLPFVPVGARGRAESFVTAAGAGPAITVELDPRLLDPNTSRREFAGRCAELIVTLLNDERAGFEHPERGFSRLRPADIAVLVRTGKEAAAVRRELRRRNVASVYLSDQASVFDSGEARDLLHWLKAVASPRDVRLARAALASRMVGLSIEELLVLATDDEAFDARIEQLGRLYAIWHGQGVLSMLRQTLHLLDLPARWKVARTGDDPDHATDDAADGAADGERRLTNFLHLAELLQAASAQLDGEQALIRWLAGQMDGGSSGGDEQIVRLESDADLVKVVTVHKAKGLEYPLVFLPFVSNFRSVDNARTRFVSLVDSQGHRTLYLQPTKAQLAAADRERQREDLRLLYVAATRAQHGLWLGVAALKVGQGKECVFHRSAVGYMLTGPDTVGEEAFVARIDAALGTCADIAIELASAPEQVARTPLRPRGVPVPLRALVPYVARFERRWTIGSFTALTRALAMPGLWSASVAVAKDDELPDGPDLSKPQRLPTPAASTGQPWHSFPRGAVPGNFLHDQLEWLAGEGFDLDESTELAQQLLRRCERQGWGTRGPQVLRWLTEVVKTPLPPVGTTLDAIRRPLPEMEFWFPSEGLDSGAVDALCRAHLLGARDRPALPAREMRGMLMGFADLVFEHEGRYWVLDYKSNHLGPGDADYADDALEAAMAMHRYDVQAALYLLALHRLLRARLGAAYDPARQLGGALYLFLRGIRGPAGGCYRVAPSMPFLSALDALLRGPDKVLP